MDPEAVVQFIFIWMCVWSGFGVLLCIYIIYKYICLRKEHGNDIKNN